MKIRQAVVRKMDIQQFLPVRGGLGIGGGQLDMGPSGQELHRLGKGHILLEHQETEDVSSHPAAEAVKDLLRRTHGKRRGLFLVEGTERLVVLPGPLEGDITGDHLDDIVLRLDVFQ